MNIIKMRVAIVSGGSRGLGRTIVENLISEGWKVATFSRNKNEFIDRYQKVYPEQFYWCGLDLASGQLSSFVESVVVRFGGVRLLINNGAVLHQGLFLSTPVEKIDEMVCANLLGPIKLTLACIRTMAQQKVGGSIINISSVGAIRGYRGTAVYSATKAGLDGFTRSLAREVGPLNIRVNSVVPGMFDSDLSACVTDINRDKIIKHTPLGRYAELTDIQHVVSFLNSPLGEFITGQSIVIDGGLTC
ncbi:SDR family oxidoreductase [Citrobacter sp. S2-9]|uniref:SDR family oxidoreductase n=1 Tax=Citrobacter enshiensis TaxID=2971264 RepID=A0ABT8PW52_9ENTR|nr:SDR family oxidoreductase [Citrobacter enshiensis]MDN8600273.1 SDR family oxidoreductase [Citrobacter enshiensis]